jgi:hypothetical protein
LLRWAAPYGPAARRPSRPARALIEKDFRAYLRCPVLQMTVEEMTATRTPTGFAVAQTTVQTSRTALTGS